MKEILITSSVLILALLLLRAIFATKVRRTLIYGTWMLVALRLLIPVQIGNLPFSVLNSFRPVTEVATAVLEKPVAGVTQQEAQQQVLQEYIQDYIDNNQQNIEQTPQPDLPDLPDSIEPPEQVEQPEPFIPPVFTPPVQEQIQSALEQELPKEEIAGIIEKDYAEEDIYVPDVQPQVQQRVTETANPITVGHIFTAVWLLGIAVVAIWLTVANVQAVCDLRKSAKPIKWDSPIPVYVSEKAFSPCLVGLFRPTIYLTPESVEDENVLRCVMTHELTHYYHRDYIWAVVRCLCLCLYWFNPLVWVAAWCSRRDCELACDEGALQRLGEEQRIAYGRALLLMVRNASVSGRLMLTATAMAETKKQLLRRVNFIARKPHWSIVAAISMVLVCAIVAGCVAAGPKAAPTAIDPDQPNMEAVADPTTDPTTTEPSVTEPTVTEPSVTQPSVTDPTVTQPTVTDPTVTEPAVTNPTVPAPTTPEPTVPPSTQPQDIETQMKQDFLKSSRNLTRDHTCTVDDVAIAFASPAGSGYIVIIGCTKCSFTMEPSWEDLTSTTYNDLRFYHPEEWRLAFWTHGPLDWLKTTTPPTSLNYEQTWGVWKDYNAKFPKAYERWQQSNPGKTEPPSVQPPYVLEYKVNKDGKTCTVTGVSQIQNTDIVVPETLDGYRVVSIGERALGDRNITSLVIPDTVATIYGSAFSGGLNLKSITLPKNVSFIGSGHFTACQSLTTITLPETMDTIPSNAFSDCRSLTEITIPNGVTHIDDGAFSACYKLTRITIPDSVTTIDALVFSNCTNLTSIVLPSKLEKISSYAFDGCTGLTEITIPNGVTQIEQIAFRGCTSLTQVTIPNSVTSIGSSAFNRCSSLTEITIPDSVVSIDRQAFSCCTSLDRVIFGKGLKEIDIYAFQGCNPVSQIYVPPENTALLIFNNCLYTAETRTLLLSGKGT